jgi:hypothetical protein
MILDGKKICLPDPDSIYPYKRRLKYLKRVLGHLLVDDMFIELTDSKLGQGAVGIAMKSISKSRLLFKDLCSKDTYFQRHKTASSKRPSPL